MSSHKQVLSQLTIAAHRAYQRGIQTGSGGNLSARTPGSDWMIVKSSGGSFADTTADGKGWIMTSFSGIPAADEVGTPTREFILHGSIYQHCPQIGAIVHCHAPYSISWAFGADELPMVTYHCQLKFGCAIPVVDIPAPVVPLEGMPQILALLDANPSLPGLILRGHGLVAFGRNAVEAEHQAEMIEETAQIALLKKITERMGSN